MLNNVNCNCPEFPIRNIPTVKKDRLPKRPFDPVGFNGPDIVWGCSAGGNREVEEFKKTLAQSDNTKENKPEISEKSTAESIASVIAKEGAYRLTGSTLLKGNPYLVAATLLGIDIEEDGNAFKIGAETGKIGDFKDDYKEFFKGLDKRASKSYFAAAKEGFNLPGNLVAICVADCMQTLGAGMSKILGEEITAFLGNGIATAGNALNAIGDIGSNTVKSIWGIGKNLFKGDFDGMADSAVNIYDGAKDSVVDVAKQVADFATDGANLVADGAVEAYDLAKEGANYIADAAEDAYDAVADVAEDAWDGVSDAAEAVGDFAEDAWDEVEDFFGGIF